MIYEALLKDVQSLTNKQCFYNIGQVENSEEHNTISEDTILLNLPSVEYIETGSHIVIQDLELTLVLVSSTLEGAIKLSKEVHETLFNKELPTLKENIHIIGIEPGTQDTVSTFNLTLKFFRIELERPDSKSYIKGNIKPVYKPGTRKLFT